MSDERTATPDSERLSWAQTRALIRSDFQRLVTWYGGGSLAKQMYWFLLPNYQALFFYRLYRHLYLRGWRNASRLLFLHSLYLTGIEISPTTSIGPGCLITHAFGVILFGKIGARCSFFGQCGMGGGMGIKDVGGGPGYPVIGDDVEFGIKSVVLGAVRVGERVRLGPGAFVTSDVPDDAVVVNLPSKITRFRMPPPVPAASGESQDP